MSPGVDTQLWDCSLDFPPLYNLSGSLELPFPILWPKSWGFSFSTLLFPTMYLNQASRGEKIKSREICFTLMGQLLWSEIVLLPCNFVPAQPLLLSLPGSYLGLEVGEREKRKTMGISPNLWPLEIPFLPLRPATEGSKRSPSSSHLMYIFRFWATFESILGNSGKGKTVNSPLV